MHKGEGSTPGMFLVDEIQRLEKTMQCNNKGDVLGDTSFSSTAVTQRAELEKN